MKRLLVWTLAALPLWVSAQVFGTVEAVSGTVQITAQDGAVSSASVGQSLSVGTTVQTQAGGELHVATQDGGLLAIRPNTTFVMRQYLASQDNQGEMVMSLVRGALRSITGWIGKLNPKGYRIVTPTATVGIRGTDHETTVLETTHGRDLPGTYDTVHEGATVLHSGQAEVLLSAGQHGFAGHDASGAPHVLAQRPDFLGQRALRLEDRIPERKANLSDRVQQVLANRSDMERNVRDRVESMTDEQRDAARKRLLRKLPRNRGD